MRAMTRTSEHAPSRRDVESIGAQPVRVGRPVASRRWIAALALVCVGSLWLHFNHIDGTLPYPWDTDEPELSGPAIRMLAAGSLNPVTFRYPSLPKYLAAFGMSVGFLRGAAHREI